MSDKTGEIIIKSGIDVWEHERRTAQALANAGFVVLFIKRSDDEYVRTPDVVIDGILWEMKSPISNRLPKIQKTLRQAIHQSPNVIYDSQRIKNLNDNQIQRELEKWAVQFKAMKRLIFVNKKREVIVIK
ncbi:MULTISPECIES: hypothetical protein [unclassified Adlercreutzia]|uniref:CdiA C-terminal domain-containing protein n=1 Tax=unclassified Adlercreutzia TaxID=2636013 RepID=UPI0013EBA874|nr:MULTISPECIES: hypothetical protein [unclassified Adlercreutzia]